jgi:hypothetical protein
VTWCGTRGFLASRLDTSDARNARTGEVRFCLGVICQATLRGQTQVTYGDDARDAGEVKRRNANVTRSRDTRELAQELPGHAARLG